MGILYAMSTHIQKVFGLNNESIKYLNTIFNTIEHSAKNKIALTVNKFIDSFVNKKAIEIFLKRFELKILLKTL